MKRRHMPEAHAAHPNVTPLIDVVMCLIIFFMLVAKIGVDTGGDARIAVPASILGTDIKDMGNTLTLNVVPGANDLPLVTGLLQDPNNPSTNVKQEIRLQDGTRKPLLETLKLLRFGDKKRNQADNPDFKVIIRAGEDLEFKYLEPVLQTCAEAKVKSVNYNTKKTDVVVPG